LGFGPKLFSFKGKDTTYSLRGLPLGGFVALAGMDEPPQAQEAVPEDDPANFQSRPLWQRMLIIASGPLMNFVLAILLFALYFNQLGVPTCPIQEVQKGSPAQQAGLQVGDILVGNSPTVPITSEQLVWKISRSANKTFRLYFLRAGKMESRLVTPTAKKDGSGLLGITFGGEGKTYRLGAWGSLRQGWLYNNLMLQMVVQALGRMFRGTGLKEMTGPVGMFKVVGQVAPHGLLPILGLAAMISTNLGLFNLIPLPVLDGGWLLFLIIEGVRGKPLKPEQQGMAQMVGMALLLLLFVLVTFQDLVRLKLS
jgi:regulator of sigma E protease